MGVKCSEQNQAIVFRKAFSGVEECFVTAVPRPATDQGEGGGPVLNGSSKSPSASLRLAGGRSWRERCMQVGGAAADRATVTQLDRGAR